jgi:hypothetical protein
VVAHLSDPDQRAEQRRDDAQQSNDYVETLQHLHILADA